MLRILSCDKYTPTVCMLQLLNWLSIERIFRRANLILIYKIEHGKLPLFKEVPRKKITVSFTQQSLWTTL